MRRLAQPARLRGASMRLRRAFSARVGDAYSATRRFTQADVAAFTALTHDDNPLHSDADAGRFGGSVVHGMLCASMFGAIVGQRFPGAIYVSQTLHFRKPVYVGEEVTATVEVQRAAAAGRVLDFVTRCVNARGDGVLDGEARVLLPRKSRHRAASNDDV